MSGRAATHRRAPCFPWPGYGPMTAGATSPRTATTTGPCACPIRRARKPCCGTTNDTMSSSCSTGISAAAQEASAARFFSISRRTAIRPRRAASPFRHAIWRACCPICRSERFSGSRDSDRAVAIRPGGACSRSVRSAAASRVLSQARTVSRRRDPAVGIAGQRLAVISGSCARSGSICGGRRKRGGGPFTGFDEKAPRAPGAKGPAGRITGIRGIGP